MRKCKVFRSDRKNDTYLYIDEATEFTDLPAELQAMFGEPEFVIALELSPGRKLARVKVQSVMQALQDQGYFLQLPPKIPTEEEISRRLS